MRGRGRAVRDGVLPGVVQSLRLEVADSTQEIARGLAEGGAPAWTLVRADRQRRGRGRMGRRWSSGPGGLYFSLIVRPEISPGRLADLSLAIAEACALAISRATGLATLVKPPNDVLARRSADEAPRKVSGILLEAAGDSRRVHWVVVGVGVNVNNRVPRSLTQAASLAALAGRELDAEALLAALLAALQRTCPTGPLTSM